MDYMQDDPSAYMVSLFFGHLQPPQTSLVVSEHTPMGLRQVRQCLGLQFCGNAGIAAFAKSG